MEQEIKWFIGGDPNKEAPDAKKLPYVSPWKTFSKLTDDEKEKIFNSMRGELIVTGRMENK